MYRVRALQSAPPRLGQAALMTAAKVTAFSPAVIVGALALGYGVWWLVTGRHR